MHTHDQMIVTSVIFGAGVITLLVCLPLIYRKIPMNRFYGIRIPEAFTSDHRWYEVNAYGGRQLAWSACVIIVVGLVGFVVPVHIFSAYALVAAGVIVVSVFTPLIQIIRWARATRD